MAKTEKGESSSSLERSTARDRARKSLFLLRCPNIISWYDLLERGTRIIIPLSDSADAAVSAKARAAARARAITFDTRDNRGGRALAGEGYCKKIGRHRRTA